MSLSWTEKKSNVTFSAFLILTDTNNPSPSDSLLAVTDYVSRAVVTWQGCLDWPGDVTESSTEMSTTHGSFHVAVIGKVILDPVSEGMAVRSSCLLMCRWLGLEEKQETRGRQEEFLESLACMPLAFVNPSPCSHGEFLSLPQILHPWHLFEKLYAEVSTGVT